MKVDIRIKLPEGKDIAVECEFDSSNNPDKDALARIKTGEFLSSVAVAIPKSSSHCVKKKLGRYFNLIQPN
ncbi:MAG: hypothetical protein OXB93_00030 [Cytophagales bacterium]|nr:hypothetical protein [Cytophagales bacterium]